MEAAAGRPVAEGSSALIHQKLAGLLYLSIAKGYWMPYLGNHKKEKAAGRNHQAKIAGLNKVEIWGEELLHISQP